MALLYIYGYTYKSIQIYHITLNIILKNKTQKVMDNKIIYIYTYNLNTTVYI